MNRTVVSVATDSWAIGQQRLIREFGVFGEKVLAWTNQLPLGCPPHRSDGGACRGDASQCVPYAFKPYAMKTAADMGAESILWADACIQPLRHIDTIWERIEEDGVWLCQNGWKNSDWTADSAYPDLFADEWPGPGGLDYFRNLNSFRHVIATTFGLSMKHPKGRAFLAEYFRLASETKAFCGPWQNSAAPSMVGVNNGRPSRVCGPPSTLGHRHDQSAAAVIAWRLDIPLSTPPKYFAYAGYSTEETLLVANGEY